MSREATEAMKKALEPPPGIAAELRKTADLLRRMPTFDTEPLRHLIDQPQIRIGPSAETIATQAVVEEVAELREIAAAQSEQIAAIVDLATELKPALEDYARTTRRAANVQIGLGVVLVLLTIVLAALTGVLVFGGP